MLKVTKHDGYLKLSIPDMLDRIELLRLVEAYGVTRAWSDLHTEHNSGLTIIDPEVWFVGLTSNPYIVAFDDDVMEDDTGNNLEIRGNIYLYSNYMTSDPVERLIVGDEVILGVGIGVSDENPVIHVGRT